MSEFKDVLNKKELIETKLNLIKLKTVLEQKIEEKMQELIQLKEEIPHLIHLERLSEIEKRKREENERTDSI